MSEVKPINKKMIMSFVNVSALLFVVLFFLIWYPSRISGVVCACMDLSHGQYGIKYYNGLETFYDNDCNRLLKSKYNIVITRAAYGDEMKTAQDFQKSYNRIMDAELNKKYHKNIKEILREVMFEASKQSKAVHG
jgi:hypothetical protein